MNLFMRIQRVRDSECFSSLEPADRSFIGWMVEMMDGHYENTLPPEKITLYDVYTFDQLQRFRRIEEVLIG